MRLASGAKSRTLLRPDSKAGSLVNSMAQLTAQSGGVTPTIAMPPIIGMPPIFMFGFERSGTTLLSMMVGAHPRIAVPLTVTGLWYRYAARLDQYGHLAGREDLERVVDDLLGEERIRLWDVKFGRDEVLAGLIPGSFARVVERFHELYARHKDKPCWGNLDIATLDHMDDACRWFPNARFLHIVRDGRDVVLSHDTMPYRAGNTLDTAERWVHRLRVNLKMGSILGGDRYKVIRYEDLVLDTEATLRGICEFMGVPYSPAMLDYPRMVAQKVPEDRRWLWPALDRPPVRSKVYGWKARMGKSRRVVFEGFANPLLKELGYEAYERVPKHPPAYVYELGCFLGRGGRFARLARRLGIHRASRLERSWRARGRYQTVQQSAFGTLVKAGTYGVDFEHALQARSFFEECMRYACAQAPSADGLTVIDCGCGPGAWLDVLARMDDAGHGLRCYGFDLTPEMVEVARQRLDGRVPAAHLQTGDILRDESYDFEHPGQRYQILYAYDVIQQLPRQMQLDACRAMLRRLAPGGLAVIFDHDRDSRYGRIMGLKKFVTRYLGIGLVPRYYCNARYPALARLAARIEASGSFVTEIRLAPDGRKRALMIRSLSETRYGGRADER